MGELAASTPAGGFEHACLALLGATEALADCIMADVEAEELAAAFEARDSAFVALRAITRQGAAPNAAGRAALDRIRQLDEAMIAAGESLVGALRDERHDLHRRRSAIQAHASREREEPRLVTVKA